MTYDALLSLRGWGVAELRDARPEFLAAARFAMFAERLMPQLEQAKEVQAIDMRTVDKANKGRVGLAKVQAGQVIESLRSLLFPED